MSSGINASREKTDVVRNFWINEDEGTRSRSTIRCNRMVLPMRNKRGEERVVIRGKSLTGTLRMALVLMQAYRLKGTLTSEESVREYSYNWAQSLSKLDTKFMPGNWVAVYVNGAPVFSTAESDDMDSIERVAAGGTVAQELLEDNFGDFQTGTEELMFQHDSQLSLVLNSLEKSVKCSILERSVVSEGTLSFAFARRKRGALQQALELAVNIIEGSTLHRQYTILRQQEKKVKGRELLQLTEVITEIKERLHEINNYISVASNNNSIQFWPDQPKFTLAG